MKRLASNLFTISLLLGTAFFSLPTMASSEAAFDPLDGQAYSVNHGAAVCPVGTFSQGILDAHGRVIGVTCNVDGSGKDSIQGTPTNVIHSNSGGRCGAGGWEQGVMDWRGEFRGTICNYPNNSNGGN